MAFARTTAVAGVGTVSCSSTTTVTGVGTAFAFTIGAAPATTAPRVGGTITVGGVTKTITAIASATSLTVDSAFGTFTAQAFTCQTGITQTGTDTMNLSLGAATGFTITNRGDLYRTFDAGGQDLFIEGTLTVESRVAQLRNDGSCASRFEVRGSATGGEIIFNGRKAAAANAPFPYPGLDWQGNNGNKTSKLVSTNVLYPAKFTMIDACVRYGADWLTTDLNNFSTITTSGDICWILCAKGTGTGQARLRQDNTTASINFTATKTYVGVWLNFGVPQTSLAGYTPVDTDGPEINMASVAVASRVLIENYVTTYILASYYAGSQIVLYGGAWTRLKNNLLGTNSVWMSQAASGRNVLEYSKQITIRQQDSAGNLLSNGFMYYQPVGSNVAGIRAKGGLVDITFDLTQQTIQTEAGAATSEFPFAWGYATASGNQSTYAYFCSGTTPGAESHVIRSSRYGYDKQSATVTLSGNNAATPSFVHSSLPTTNKDIPTAAAITGVTANFSTKTLTVAGTRTIQQIYDSYQYQLNLPANLQQANEATVTGSQTLYTGWSLVVAPSAVITAGGNFDYIFANTVTFADSTTMPYLFNAGGVLQASGVLLDQTVLGVQGSYTASGAITALYASNAGASTTFQFQGVTTGTSLVIYDASGVTKYFQQEVTTAGTYSYYIAPGTAGTYTWAIEKYGTKRESGSFAANTGGLLFYVPAYAEDVGITQATKATTAGYTTPETNSKVYDYIAYLRLSEQFIKLGQIITRSGTSLEWAAGYSAKVKATNASVLSLTGSTFFIKASSLAGDTKYTTNILVAPATMTADTTEVLTTEIEDGNGDSSVTIQAAGVSTFEVWKIPDATNPDNYATGTLLATVSAGKFRFLSANGFKFVIRDQTTNYRVVVEAEKGIYTAELFFGAAVQLAQSAEVSQINTKVDIMAIDLDAIKGTGHTKDVHSLTNIKKKAALAAALSA